MPRDHRPPERITEVNVDVSNCDREEIHLCNAVQPHGVLLSTAESDWTIRHISANSRAVIGTEPSTLLGHSVERALGREATNALQDLVASTQDLAGPPLCFASVSRETESLHFWTHRSPDGRLIVEIERAKHQEAGFHGLYADVRHTMAHLERAHSVQAFLDAAVRQIRRMTGYDRVLAYKFLEDKSGWVIAEDRDDAFDSYLGLHYPATDIPDPARRLFLMKWISHLPDANYDPVPLVPDQEPPLDLTFAQIRSVSPMYRGYLQNMGVHSTLVLTLRKEGALWGLISCMHHQGPKYVPVSMRMTAEGLARYLSLDLAAKEAADEREYRNSLSQSEQKLIANIQAKQSLVDAIMDEEGLRTSFACIGAVASWENRLHLSGECPDVETLQRLMAWLAENVHEDVYATDCLSAVYPSWSQHTQSAAGLLALRLFPGKSDYILWFRPEVQRTVNWAGDPNKPVDLLDEGGGVRIMPRRSFALWRQAVHGTSRPWRESELDAAHAIRRAILETMAQQKAEELIKVNAELTRRNEDLDAFAYIVSHDLKEPLRGTQAYAQILLQDYGSVLPDEGQQKARTLVELSRRMDELINGLTEYAKVGRMELELEPIRLEGIVQSAGKMMGQRLEESGASVRLANPPFPSIRGNMVMLRQVLTNLMANAIKYNDQPEKWIEIGIANKTDEPAGAANQPGRIVMYVKDNGIGIAPQFQQAVFDIFRRLHTRDTYGGGTGVGLTIAKKIIERHGGAIWMESEPGVGTTFFFTLASAAEPLDRDLPPV